MTDDFWWTLGLVVGTWLGGMSLGWAIGFAIKRVEDISREE